VTSSSSWGGRDERTRISLFFAVGGSQSPRRSSGSLGRKRKRQRFLRTVTHTRFPGSSSPLQFTAITACGHSELACLGGFFALISVSMIYLASPYSHPDPASRQERYEKVSALTAALVKLGHAVFCPIAYSHPLGERFGMAGDWETWKHIDLAFIQKCDELWVHELPGWEKSIGVTEECLKAREWGKLVEYVSEEKAARFIEAAHKLSGGA
jgi:hypothetical protein